MRVHFVVHEAFEAPGALETWVAQRGHGAAYSRVYLGEPLPADPKELDMLIVLGGPQSPSTTKAECSHFDAPAECALMRSCIAGGKIVIGICLGAQLLGEAVGAACEHSPEKEIGRFPIVLSEAGAQDVHLASFGREMDAGHWHADMPGLTPDAVVLASSEGCPRQIIRYAERAYGLQCHLELTPEVVELLIAASDAELRESRGRRFVQQAKELRGQDFRAMNGRLFAFLDSLTAAYGDETGVERSATRCER